MSLRKESRFMRNKRGEKDSEPGWTAEHIRKGLQDAEAGLFATDRQVTDAFERWRKQRVGQQRSGDRSSLRPQTRGRGP